MGVGVCCPHPHVGTYEQSSLAATVATTTTSPALIVGGFNAAHKI